MTEKTNLFPNLIWFRETNRLKMAIAASIMLWCATPQQAAADTYEKHEIASVQQQKVKTTGTVVDQNGEAMIGVSVKVKDNATMGTITDLEGKFSIDAPKGATLEISYIGYKTVTVKEGDELELGSHKLTFIMAPMVHWPEVMVSYESAEKVLFSADGFGTFGALDAQEDDWACEARRYYFNICGKYGVQVQNLLKKAANLDIRKICPLHGPVLDENLGWYIGLYDTWSKYEPETEGVFIAYCSVHGNTAKAAEKLCEIIKSKTDKKVSIADLSRTDIAEDIEDAFRFSRMVVIAPSYDGGVFPIMNDFLHHLKIKGYKNRKVAMVENGSWAPSAAKTMRTYLEEMKNVEICPTVVTIRSAMKEENIPQLEQLADEILG